MKFSDFFKISITVKVLIFLLIAALFPLFLSQTMADKILDEVMNISVEKGLKGGKDAHKEAYSALRGQARNNLIQLAKARSEEINTAIAETEAVIEVTSEFLIRINMREFIKTWPLFNGESLPKTSGSLEPAGAAMDFSNRHNRLITYNGASWQAPSNLEPQIIHSSTRRYESISYIMHLIYRQLPHALWFNYTTMEGVSFTYPGTATRSGPQDSRDNLWYKDAIKGSGIKWSPVYKDNESDTLSAICSKAVYGPVQELLGVISVQVSITEIFKRLLGKYSTPISTMTLIDPWGNICGQNGEIITDIQWDLTRSMDRDNLSTNIAGTIADNTPFGAELGTGTCSFYDKPAYIAYSPIPQLRWSFGIVQLQEDVLKTAELVNEKISEGLISLSDDLEKEVKSYKRRLIGTRFLIGISAIIFAFLLARGISKPLIRLSSVANLITTGDLSARSNIKRDDEIGNLANAMDNMAMALQKNMNDLKMSNQSLERRVQEISHLYEFSMGITDTLILKEITEKAVAITARSFGISNAIAFIINREETAIKALSIKGLDYSSALNNEFALDKELSPYLNHLIVRDEISGSPLIKQIDRVCKTKTTRAILCPLITPSGLIGALFIGATDRERPFRAGDFRLFKGFAVQLGGAFENAILNAQVLEKKKMEHELKLASKIQRDILPQSFPEIPLLDMAGFNLPALQVGGDFYDVFEMANNKIGFVIADVSGKGMAAALLMALSRATIRSQAMLSSSPKEILERTNKLLAPDLRTGMFITAFIGIYDTDESTLSYSCGGHNPPIYFSAQGKQSLLSTKGIALGILDEIELLENKVELFKGDTVVFYTDGITDAMNDIMKPLGMIPLIRRIGENRDKPSKEIIDSIIAMIDDYSGSNAQHDDITMMVVKKC